VNLDCSHTDTKIEGNKLVWLPGHEGLKYLPLAWSERIDRRQRGSNIIGSALRRAGLQGGLNRRWPGSRSTTTCNSARLQPNGAAM
jgi:hypothetical protein